MITRRQVLRTAAAGTLLSTAPSILLANAGTDARLVLVILRGAADGLAIAAPYGDGNYRKMRGELALPNPGQDNGLLRLDARACARSLPRAHTWSRGRFGVS